MSAASSSSRLHRPSFATTSGAAALLAILVYARARVLDAAAAKKRAKYRGGDTPLNTPAFEEASRKLYEPQPDGSRLLLVPTPSGRIRKVAIWPTKKSTFEAHRKDFVAQSGVASAIAAAAATTGKSGDGPAKSVAAAGQSAATAANKVRVNKEFFRQLRAILKIIIPRWVFQLRFRINSLLIGLRCRSTSKEVFLFSLHTFFLLLRTYLSLLVAKLDGMIVRDLVSANGRGFLRGLAYWWLLAIPSTYTNSVIRYLQSKLAISFRTRLTRCRSLSP
jgi:ATP-binding cassette subfamily D (ALD) long-chain fatty acid import protein